MKRINWNDEYQKKVRTAEEAIKMIRSGQRLFIGSSCGEPQYLVNTLLDRARYYSDIEIVSLLGLESSIISLMTDESHGTRFNLRYVYQGSAETESLSFNRRFLTPVNLSAVPRFFSNRHLPIHFALIQVSPPDNFGWMNLGISVDITKAGAQSADRVIVQVNPKMPVVQGHGYIHISEVDMIVEKEEELLTVFDVPEYASAPELAGLVANLIDDGSTIQLGLGIISREISNALKEKNDLGIHTQSLINGIMDLADMGVITNRHKGLNNGKLVAGNAIGTKSLYESLHHNPSVEFRPSDYVNNPAVISGHNRMVSINEAVAMDLTGQVAAEALPENQFSGVTGMADFVRGSALSRGGKTIIVIPSATIDGKNSRILPKLDCRSVIPADDVYHVVSEFGSVNLFGKNLQERAMSMISIAHPDFRESLFQQAREMGILGRERTLTESLFGIYPAKLEETRTYNGLKVLFRPAKPVDDRLIQEHFYNMDEEDIILRFFQKKKNFFRKDMEGMFQVDYVKDLSIVAIIEESSLEKIIGVGAYMLEPRGDAEVAFSVSGEWQGKGIAGVLIHKLAEAARENGISKLTAYVMPNNKGMINLFKKLPYKVSTSYEDDMLVMSTDFNEPVRRD